VIKTGSGTGTVFGPGIDCGSVCMNMYGNRTGVILKAIPSPDASFVGWTVNEVPSESLILITGQSIVTATFDPQ
jgi:hypothetical protein